MTDLTPPEIIAWLGTWPLTEQLVTLHAMAVAIPTLRRSYPLKERMGRFATNYNLPPRS